MRCLMRAQCGIREVGPSGSSKRRGRFPRHFLYREYRLAQAADYACAVELTALKYRAHEETATDRRFFGSWGAFRRNVLKTVRKKAL